MVEFPPLLPLLPLLPFLKPSNPSRGRFRCTGLHSQERPGRANLRTGGWVSKRVRENRTDTRFDLFSAVYDLGIAFLFR